MNLRVVIVDDEQAARSRLSQLIDDMGRDAGIEIVGEAADGESALSLIAERAPDVVLLDIAMREVDGLDVARHLPTPAPLVIFQTAHQHFAAVAFEVEAVDFVLKPVTAKRLSEALDRARRRRATGAPAPWTPERAARVGMAFGHVSTMPERLLVRQAGGHRLVPLASIDRFTATEGTVRAHVDGQSRLVDYTLTELATRLRAGFVQVSRAELVNVAAITAVRSNGDGSVTVTMRDGTACEVSRRRSTSVRERLTSG